MLVTRPEKGLCAPKSLQERTRPLDERKSLADEDQERSTAGVWREILHHGWTHVTEQLRVQPQDITDDEVSSILRRLC